MKINKALISIIISLFIVLVLAACNAKKKGEKITIRWAGDSPIRTQMINQFQQLNPNIQIQKFNTKQISTKLLAQFAANDPIELFSLNGSDQVNAYYKRGLLLDLEPYMKEAGYTLEDFHPVMREIMVVDGKWIGVPDNYGVKGFLINQDIFEKNGIETPKSDWRIDQAIQIATKITDRDNMIIGLSKYDFLPLFYQSGGAMFSSDLKKVTVNSPAGQKAIHILDSMYFRYKCVPSAADLESATEDGWQDNFVQGTFGMQFNGQWMLASLKNVQFKWDFIVPPMIENQRSSIHSKVWLVPANMSEEKKVAAVKVILFLLNETSTRRLCSTGDGFPSLKKYGEDFISKNAPVTSKQVATITKILNNKPYYVIPKNENITTPGLTEAINEVNKMFVSQKLNEETFLPALEKRIEDFMK